MAQSLKSHYNNAMTTHDLKHLYIHIPFCQTRCAYCDFNTFANREDFMQRYIDALCLHLERMASGETTPDPAWPSTIAQPVPWASYRLQDLAGPLQQADLPATVFLGGGTPTALPLPLLEQLMQTIGRIIPLEQAEVTSEANPGTVLDLNYLRAMRSMGINRLSMGVQTLHDPTLRVLGRIHTASEAYASYQAARKVGFENINLDFMFGLPGQDIAQWRAMLKEIVSWDTEHFALYSLIVEPTTPLAAQVTAGRVSIPNDDATGEMYEAAMDILGAAGYGHYEISNWAKTQSAIFNPSASLPAYASRHNVAYWLNADYLGVGAGAHSHWRGWRWVDQRVLEPFAQQVERGQAPLIDIQQCEPHDRDFETIMMGLRLNCGLGLAHFQQRTGHDLLERYQPVIDQLIEQGMLEQTSNAIRFTPRGRMVGNQVIERFLID